jgi:hypothetical protein
MMLQAWVGVLVGRLPLMLIGLDPDLMCWLPEGGLPRTNLVEADPHPSRVRVCDVQAFSDGSVIHGGASYPFRGYSRDKPP